MRALSSAVLSLLISVAAFASATVGTNQILVDAPAGVGGSEPRWVSMATGRTTPILIVSQLATSSATDGHRFLVVWNDGTIQAGLFDEGAALPSVTLTIEKDPGSSSPIVRWDGTRYVVFWTPRFAMSRVATVSADGFMSPAFFVSNFRSVDAAACNGTLCAVASKFDVTTDSKTERVVDVALLDRNLTLVKQTRIDSMPREADIFATDVAPIALAPFGSGFYAAVTNLRSGAVTYEETAGTRITADGSALDVAASPREANSVSGRVLDSVPSFATMKGIDIHAPVVVVKRDNTAAATWLTSDGQIAGHLTLTFPPWWQLETVRLPNGSIVLLRIDATTGAASFTPLSGRRRAAH